MKYIRAFGLFWWNFIVGDDWRVAAGIAAALGITAILTQESVDVWWLLPLGLAAVLASSLWRATNRG